MRVIRGKQALVTGAASGIGRAIAHKLAEAGADLFLVDIDADQLDKTADECRRHQVDVAYTRCDVSHPREISRVVRHLLDRWGGVDILINNAGVAYYGRTELMSASQWEHVLAVNLHAPIQFTRELLPSLLDRRETHLVNVCSIAGLIPLRKLAAYETTKFGLVGFSLSLRAEFWRYGLGVTALCPGFVQTGLFDTTMHGRIPRPLPVPPWWMLGTPKAVAAACLRAIGKNQGLVTVTPLARCLWGMQRLSPALMGFFCRGLFKRCDPLPIPAVAAHSEDRLAA